MKGVSSLFDSMYNSLLGDIHAHITTQEVTKSSQDKPLGLDCDLDTSSPHHFAILALLKSIPKKYIGGDSRLFVGNSPEVRQHNAIALWESMNNRCSETNNRLKSKLSVFAETVIGEAQCFIHDWFGGNCNSSVPVQGLISEFGHGPGVSQGVDGCDFFTKVADSSLTYHDESVGAFYRRVVKDHPLWQEAETIRLQNHGDGKVVIPKLTTVAKTNVIDRTIEIGGSLSVAFQLAVGRMMTSVLKSSVGIDLAVQPDINRNLARLGSTGKSNHGKRWCTIDLSSASDTISLGLTERLFAFCPDWYHVISWLRTRQVTLPDGRTVECYMTSSMGNGFTFPLQTIIFASLVCAVYALQGKKPFREHRKLIVADDGTSHYRDVKRPEFAVFGDDIVIDEEVYDISMSLLDELGFIPNKEKSFSSGFFRESCGTDWFQGVNVRAVYCTELCSIQNRISLVNRLNRWSAYHSVPLPRTIATLVAGIPVKARYVVPNYEGDDAGIHVSLSVAQSAASYSLLPLPNVKESLRLRLGATGDSIVYHTFEVKKKFLAFWVRVRRDGIMSVVEKKAEVNPSGTLLTALHGDIRGDRMWLRMDRVRYKNSFGISPGWGDPSYLGGASAHWAGSYAHWEVSVDRNLDRLRPSFVS